MHFTLSTPTLVCKAEYQELLPKLKLSENNKHNTETKADKINIFLKLLTLALNLTWVDELITPKYYSEDFALLSFSQRYE